MSSLRIVEPEPNRRGDLFGRLMADLFVALGYDQPQMNVHKSGREIDLQAKHRFEARRAIGECKATGTPIGGTDLNKFVGVLDVEHDDKVSTVGYFISLSGFTATAIEQEQQRKRTKIVVLTGTDVVDELVKGRIIIPTERATEQAGRCCAEQIDCILEENTELIAHERGWIWIVYYSRAKARSHFVLVHADGTLLARKLADEIIVSDKACDGLLHTLTCLNPIPVASMDSPEAISAALSAYGRYIVEECGYIHLDGLPADSEVGSRRMKLENLFVPLHLDIPKEEKLRQKVGSVLTTHTRLALLAAPGGGKSTLIKRLAVAYADSARRSEATDDLPELNWLPLFFRCRELLGLARGSFAELIEALSQREPVRQHAAPFRSIVNRALTEGRVLLLIDGLDEISDAGDRAAFVCTLRTALQAYPGTSIIVTSREAGFRHVAAHLTPVCTYAHLSTFDAKDVQRLSVAWHTEVVGNTEKVRFDAEELALSIFRNDRIRRLAINPLLLTTLLLVKRWVGSLPTRRAILYGKAVEVLLMTWNTEGHDPIPEEEALPQLCYVASAMMMQEVERISRPRLTDLLLEARASLPTELGYVKGTVEDFINRVEDRSSLLMMTGHDIENGLLVEFFEFRHLTFQEFLTARAMVHGWHPGRLEKDSLVTVLEPYFDKEKWREVIPLAASLGGKATEQLIEKLADRLNNIGIEPRPSESSRPSFAILGNCLADEAAARPDTIRTALKALLRIGVGQRGTSFVTTLARGRYGDQLLKEAEEAFLSDEEFSKSASSLQQVMWSRSTDFVTQNDLLGPAVRFTEMLNSPNLLTRCEGGLLWVELLRFAPNVTRKGRSFKEAVLTSMVDALLPMLFSDSTAEHYIAGWNFFELGRQGLEKPRTTPDVLGRMFELWRHSASKSVRNGLPSTFAVQPLISREDQKACCTVNKSDIDNLLESYDKLNIPYEKIGALILAWYSKTLSDNEIIVRSSALLETESGVYKYIIENLLRELGVNIVKDKNTDLRARNSMQTALGVTPGS